MKKMDPAQQEKLANAKKQVEELKGFYWHLLIYLVVNGTLFLMATGIFNFSLEQMHFPNWGYYTTPFFWGIGLAFHALYVFKLKISLFRKWEERKIKEYLAREEREVEAFTKNKN